MERLTQEQTKEIEDILKGVVPKGKVGVLIYSGEEDIEPELLIRSVKAQLGSSGFSTLDLETADEEEAVQP